ncbi:MAG: DoxX family protein [Gemmatimonadaceae bacterium]
MTNGEQLDASSRPRGRMWMSLGMSAIAVLFLAFDGVTKLMLVPPVVTGMKQLGYPASAAFGIGTVLLICTVLYVVPRTAVLGAVLLTGYLGGAVASQVRVNAPLLSRVLFPIYVAVFIWGGLYLRDSRVRALLPFGR